MEETNLHTEKLKNNQSKFPIFPVEIEIHILNFLVEQIFGKETDPVKKFVNIVSNKNLADLKRVSQSWDFIITNKVAKLVGNLIQNNKSLLESKLIEICKMHNDEVKKEERINKLMIKTNKN